MKTLKVEIIIPIYNEEKNIRELLSSLISQKEKGFKISKIKVISDGCTDNSVNEARKVKDKRIKILVDGKRLGKMVRLNDAYSSSKSDILVQYDGDVIIPSNLTTYYLVRPFIKNSKIHIVFGRQYPTEPKTLVEKAAHFGFYYWENAKEMLKEKSVRYRVHGQIRAFSKTFYSSYRIPEKNAISEDMFNFYMAMRKKAHCYFSKDAYIFFRLPSTLYDYINQMARYISIPSNLELFFNKGFLRRYNTMTRKVVLTSLIRQVLITNPIVTGTYIYMHLLARYRSSHYVKSPLWTINKSTKQHI
jgi:cellulose synthase/poly-beta-1,6-N-acetylglucosamine synthase-like glycosyltransferase